MRTVMQQKEMIVETEMAAAWDEYIGDDGDICVHPMFAAAFAAGWLAGVDDYQNKADGQRSAVGIPGIHVNEIAKLYFQYQDGTDDSIVLEAESVDEINKLVDAELDKRGAVFTGLECLQQCEA